MSFENNRFSEFRCYQVLCKTTNSSEDMAYNKVTDEYFDCEYGILYVVTDSPEKIYKKFGNESVLTVEKLGFGYVI